MARLYNMNIAWSCRVPCRSAFLQAYVSLLGHRRDSTSISYPLYSRKSSLTQYPDKLRFTQLIYVTSHSTTLAVNGLHTACNCSGSNDWKVGTSHLRSEWSLWLRCAPRFTARTSKRNSCSTCDYQMHRKYILRPLKTVLLQK